MDISEYGFRPAQEGEIEKRMTGRGSNRSRVLFESFLASSDEVRARGVVREFEDSWSAHRFYSALRSYQKHHHEYDSVFVRIVGSTVFLVERDAE